MIVFLVSVGLLENVRHEMKIKEREERFNQPPCWDVAWDSKINEQTLG